MHSILASNLYSPCLHLLIASITNVHHGPFVPMCGDFNKNALQRLIRSGTIKICGLVGVGVALLEVGLRSQKFKAGLVTHSLFLLPSDPDVELSALSLTPGLPAYCHVSHHDNNRANL